MNTERAALLKSLLQLHAPGAWDYQDADPAWPNEHLCVRRIARPYGQLELNVLLRRDGDIDVVFHVSGHRPQRVEAHFPVADHEA